MRIPLALDRMNVGEPSCPSFRRWRLRVGDSFSVRLHRWMAGDPPDYQHTHAWPFLTLVFRGSYTDVGPDRRPDRVRALAVRYRPAEHRHAVVDCEGCWTLVITGRVVRPWRFWIGDRSVDAHEWNARVCD